MTQGALSAPGLFLTGKAACSSLASGVFIPSRHQSPGHGFGRQLFRGSFAGRCLPRPSHSAEASPIPNTRRDESQRVLAVIAMVEMSAQPLMRVQVPHRLVLNPVSEGRISTTWSDSVNSLAMMSSSSPLKPLSRAQ